ncbi:MAG: hypothetical protein JO111_17730 [Caulobacteraceae bacterium]|nr:hypothetical protein [Caulobacteraceae bacterium]
MPSILRLAVRASSGRLGSADCDAAAEGIAWLLFVHCQIRWGFQSWEGQGRLGAFEAVVETDLVTHQVSVHTELSPNRIAEAIRSAGYANEFFAA